MTTSPVGSAERTGNQPAETSAINLYVAPDAQFRTVPQAIGDLALTSAKNTHEAAVFSLVKSAELAIFVTRAAATVLVDGAGLVRKTVNYAVYPASVAFDIARGKQ